MGQTKKERYEKNLESTLKFMKKPRTVAEVAAKFEISKFAAYERIYELRERGLVSAGVAERPAGKTGPQALAWLAA